MANPKFLYFYLSNNDKIDKYTNRVLEQTYMYFYKLNDKHPSISYMFV